MRIHILSDLHIEFAPYNIQVLDADVLVLAGDIGVGTTGIEYAMQLLEITKSKILYVMGNHEAYHQNIDTIRRTLRKLCTPEKAFEVEQRLFFLDNDQVIIDGVRFLGTTLWTDFRLFGESKRFECLAEARWLNDFRIVHCGNGDVFRPRDSLEFHEQSLEWLTKRLNQVHEGPTVVITHHLPSGESVAERYKTDLLSACFASNLDHLFGKCDVWIHGHTHDSFDYTKNGTRVVCNPRGYTKRTNLGTEVISKESIRAGIRPTELIKEDVENKQFNPHLVIEV